MQFITFNLFENMWYVIDYNLSLSWDQNIIVIKYIFHKDLLKWCEISIRVRAKYMRFVWLGLINVTLMNWN